MIDEVFRKYQEREHSESASKIRFYGTEMCDTSSQEEDKEKVAIPPEFLDIITHEMMTVPITLPSGHVIDEKTLNQYVQNEAEWGRPSNDPFTKIFFDRNYQPTPNLELKIKIDLVLQNCSNQSDKR